MSTLCMDIQVDMHVWDTAIYHTFNQNDWGVCGFKCYVTNYLKPLDFTGWTPKLNVLLPTKTKQVVTLTGTDINYEDSTVCFELSQEVTKYTGEITCQLFFEQGVEGREDFRRCTSVPQFKAKIVGSSSVYVSVGV